MAISTSALLERVGRRIAEVRSARGWTQADLALRLDCELTAVERAEAGERNLTLRTLNEFAAALRVDPRMLLDPPLSRPKRRPGRPKKRRDDD